MAAAARFTSASAAAASVVEPVAMELTLSLERARDWSPARRGEVIAFCSAVYDEDLADYFGNLADAVHVVGSDAAGLAAHACWVTRWLQAGSGPLLRTAYIELVATRADCRGRGHASAVMRRIANEIGGYDIAALSPAIDAFYERFGWERWRGPLYVRTGDGLVASSAEEACMVLRLPRTPPIDLDDALSIEWRPGEVW